MVPEGWNILPLGEMAEFRNGLNFAKDDDGQIVKVVTIPDFWQRTKLQDFSDVKSIQCKGKVPASSMLKSGDLLFVRSNGNPELVGRCLFFPEVDEPVSFSGFTIRGRVDPEQMMPEFASYVMVTDRTKNQFRRGRGGGNISNLSQDILAGVQVALPPLAEQRKIAEILSTWDRAIEVAQAQLANATAQKRSLMQSLLTGKHRFPEFKGQEWKEVRLGEVLDMSYGKSPKEIFEVNGNFPVIGTGGETGRTNTALTEGPAIIIGRKGTIDTPQWIDGKFWCIDTTYFCTTSEENDLRWLFAWLSSINLRVYSEASGVPSLSRETLKAIKLHVPHRPEQERIADVFINCDTDISNISLQVEHLRTEKCALMQQLLTGKRRVVTNA